MADSDKLVEALRATRDGAQIKGVATASRPTAKTGPLVVGDDVRIDGLKVRADA
jgi:hypothetical protein